jgi:hypothetical protein
VKSGGTNTPWGFGARHYDRRLFLRNNQEELNQNRRRNNSFLVRQEEKPKIESKLQENIVVVSYLHNSTNVFAPQNEFKFNERGETEGNQGVD